jgi:hypothetical protein
MGEHHELITTVTPEHRSLFLRACYSPPNSH